MEKRPFLDQKHGLTPLEKYEFFTLINLWFFFLERRFLVLEYRKRHFPAQFCQKKKKLEKWPSLKQNHGLTPLENVNFSTVWTSSFYRLERPFFVLEYRKRHFPGLHCLKKKVGKMAIFGPKPWDNRFGKMAIFRLFELLVFIA